MNADRQLAVVVRAYRALAYVTGTVLIILCFVGIPLQVWANNLVIVKYVGTAHGMLYIAYVIVAFVMTRMVRMKVASPGTVIVLLAGTIPVLTFVVERWVTRKYIDPALAASRRRQADRGRRSSPASTGGPGSPPPGQAGERAVLRQRAIGRAPRRDRCTCCCPTCTWSWRRTPASSHRGGSTREPGCCLTSHRRPPRLATCSTSAAATARWPSCSRSRSPDARVWAVDVNTRALALTVRQRGTCWPGEHHLRAPRRPAVPAADRPDLVQSAGADRQEGPARDAGRVAGRLAPGGTAYLVVQRNLGSDSLHRWLADSGWTAERAAARSGYRVLKVTSTGQGTTHRNPPRCWQAGREA